jgi:hypothetical protein
MFSLIGEPVTPDVLSSLLDLHQDLFGTQDPFVSGDYSAATDGLDIRASKIILSEILRKLDPSDHLLRPLLSEILLEQMIEYPKWSKLDPIIQRNGQLMGSILSFPILCIANSYTYFRSLPAHMQKQVLSGELPLRKLPVKVNGDDILFRASSSYSQYDSWLQSIRTVGFTPSQGKNFIHPRFFTVNSQPMEYVPDPRFRLPWQNEEVPNLDDWADDVVPLDESLRRSSALIHGYINVGLLTGQAKLTGRESLGVVPLSGWHSQSVVSAVNPPQAHKWFLHYHRETIDVMTRYGKVSLNLFAHPLLGGLGFVIPQGVIPRYSEGQRALAHQLYLAAKTPFQGQARDYPLKSLISIGTSDSAETRILGYRPQHVEVYMHPLVGPLPEGVQPFQDTSSVYETKLAHPTPFSEKSPMVATCRLTNRQLRELTTAFRHEKTLHPIEEMHRFDFRPIAISRDAVRDGVIHPIIFHWRPEEALDDFPSVPQEEEPSHPSPEDLLSLGDLLDMLVANADVPIEGSDQELWELPALPVALNDEITAGKRLLPVSERIRRELEDTSRHLRKKETVRRLRASKEFRRQFYPNKMEVEEARLQDEI